VGRDPIYTQVMYCLEEVPAWSRRSRMAKVAPFSNVLDVLHRRPRGDGNLTMDDLMKNPRATRTDAVENSSAEVSKW